MGQKRKYLLKNSCCKNLIFAKRHKNVVSFECSIIYKVMPTKQSDILFKHFVFFSTTKTKDCEIFFSYLDITLSYICIV